MRIFSLPNDNADNSFSGWIVDFDPRHEIIVEKKNGRGDFGSNLL